jgi:hypothetical protein
MNSGKRIGTRNDIVLSIFRVGVFMLKRSFWLMLGLLPAFGITSFAQGKVSDCGIAPVGSQASQPNIFTEQQEIWLGQIESDLIEADIRPVRDPALSAHLQNILDRLLNTLPPTSIQFRITLIDSDEINGFSIAGGHIYILRKLAAVAQNDDELAGVIGHEMGHIISHQFAFDTTREMKRLLNVTAIGDEADLRKKYEAMLDAEYRDKHPQLGENDSDQAQADQIGLYAMAAAGYRPEAYAEIWNRVFFVEGKTGSRIGDLLGFTKPTQKRLRSISTMIATLPKGCGRTVPADENAFNQWHRAVIANQAGTSISRSTPLSEVALNPPLHMTLDRVKFSPDGKLLLAQDQSSIFVLDREPFSLRFKIDADGALPAAFSPDSESITFATPGLHTEEWSVTEKKLRYAHELLPRKPCYDPRLSPDGRTLICVEFDLDAFEMGLAMLDTSTSEVLWEKKDWQIPSYGLAVNLMVARGVGDTSPFFVSSNSADGNVLLIGGGEAKVAFDFKQRTVLKTGGGLKGAITGEYAFLGSDKVAGINRSDQKHSAVFSFPEGKTLAKVSIPFTAVRSVSNPGLSAHLVATGLKDDAIGIADLASEKFSMVLKDQALDEYDGTAAAEARGGALVLAPLANLDPKLQKHVELPTSPLSGNTIAALSQDGRFVAISTNRLGAVWNVETGRQLALIRGFTDAAWTEDDTLYVDIPKEGNGTTHRSDFDERSSS